MKKAITVATLCAFILGFFLLPTLYAGLTYQHEYKDQDMSYEHGSYPDEMLLYAPEEYGEMREGPAKFSHSVHAEFDCTECHHFWDGEREIMGCMDAGCHDMAVAEEPADRRDIRYFYKAYHDMCMTGCHRDLSRAGEEAGPLACPDCHISE